MHDLRVTSELLRVVIAEDSALIREGIARLIEESGGTVVAKVGDGLAPPKERWLAGLPSRHRRGPIAGSA